MKCDDNKSRSEFHSVENNLDYDIKNLLMDLISLGDCFGRFI